MSDQICWPVIAGEPIRLRSLYVFREMTPELYDALAGLSGKRRAEKMRQLAQIGALKSLGRQPAEQPGTQIEGISTPMGKSVGTDGDPSAESVKVLPGEDDRNGFGEFFV